MASRQHRNFREYLAGLVFDHVEDGIEYSSFGANVKQYSEAGREILCDDKQ